MNKPSKTLFISLFALQIGSVFSPASLARQMENSDYRSIVQLSQLSQKPSAPRADSGNCDPAYPDFCLEPTDRDLDCDDLQEQHNFRVLPPDPHKFDLDGDGIGCER